MIEKTVNVEKLKEFNIYAGLKGKFGGASYQFTGLYESKDDAEEEAFQIAIQEYDSNAGHHGIRSVEDIMHKEDVDYYEAEDIYLQERDCKIVFKAILTSEDTAISKDNIIRDYVIEESSEG